MSEKPAMPTKLDAVPYMSKAEQRLLAEMFERLRPMCVAVATKITGEVALAEDAVQAAFVNVIRHRQKIFALPCHKQAPYIVIMVKNQAYDILRQRSRDASLTGCIDDAALSDVDVLADIVSAEAYDALKEMIRTLPAGYRAVFDLRYVADFTDEEIAATLGISHNAVRKRLERARKMLREMVLRKEADCGV